MAEPIRFRDVPEPSKQELERLQDLLEVDTRYGILLVIDNFGSANIKKLARILGKNEATVHHHIKWMTQDPSFLAIDQTKTMSRKGIFYQLSNFSHKFSYILGTVTKTQDSDELSIEVEDASEGSSPSKSSRTAAEKFEDLLNRSDEEIEQIHTRILEVASRTDQHVLRERRLMSYNHILEQIMLQNFEQALQAIKDRKTPTGTYPYGSLSNFPIDLKISKLRHLYQALSILTQASQQLSDLSKEIAQEMQAEGIEEEDMIDLHFHIVGGEIAEFKFE